MPLERDVPRLVDRVYEHRIESGLACVCCLPRTHTNRVPGVPNTVSIRSANSAGLILGDISDQIVEGTFTVQQALRVMLSALGGKVSGVTTTTEKFRNPDDAKDRITVTLDGSNNRTAVVLDLSD